MNASSLKFLHFTKFKDIPNWSVQYADCEYLGFTSIYPLVYIGSFLTRRKDYVDIQDDVVYKRVTISTKDGTVAIRDKKEGKKIGTKKQYLIHEGQFLLSKIDARNGAFGVVPALAEGAVITSNFWTYDVDCNRVNPLFLMLITKTKKFLEFAEKSSNGTTNRHYLQEEIFLQQRIPMPSIDEQNQIVAEYKQIIEFAEKKEKEIRLCDKKIFDFLQQELNITELVISQGNNHILHFSSLSQIHRWDCYNVPCQLNDNRYVKTLSQIIKSKPFYGAPYSAVKFDGKVRYIRITDINEDGSLSKVKVSANAYSDTYLLKENDFLIARSGNTVGKTFLYTKNVGRAIFAGYLIKFEINEEMVDPRYVLIYTKSQMFKKWIQTNMRVSAQPNINSKQYLDAPIIVPEVDVQKRIVEYANRLYDRKKSLQAETDSLRREAIDYFNKIIFE